MTTNFRVQRYRGSPVLTWWEGEIELGHGVGEYVIADASYRTIRRVQAAARLRGDLHEFVITPRDTALLTSYVVRRHDLSGVGGPAARHDPGRDLPGDRPRQRELLLEWHSLEHVLLEESYAPVEADWDFFHINSVDLDGDGDLLVSARSTHTVYKLARDGAIVWRLGGKRSDFAMGPGSIFAWQHDARRQPDGTMTVFDNGATPAVERLLTRADPRRRRADDDALRCVRQYSHPGVLSRAARAACSCCANGNVFVGWGETPRVSEFDRAGRLLFDAVLGKQYECYRAFRMPWSGPSRRRPGARARRQRAPARHGLRELERRHRGARVAAARRRQPRRAPSPSRGPARRGFESALPAPTAGPCFAVRALDAGGTDARSVGHRHARLINRARARRPHAAWRRRRRRAAW